MTTSSRADGRARRIIAVAGGKGGVGKSLLTANLAVAMAERGAAVVVVDADLGMANQHTLFGVDRPGVGLQGWLDREVGSLEEAAVPTTIAGVRLIAGTAARVGAANIHHASKQRLLRHIRAIDADVVLIDVGAGSAYNQLDFFVMADLRLLVMTAQVTAIQNCYAFLKAGVHRAMRAAATTNEQRALVDAAAAADTDTRRVSAVVAFLRERDQELATAVERALAYFTARVIGNQMSGERDRRVLGSIARMIDDFLGVRATIIGSVPNSRALHDSVNQRRPLLAHAGGGDVAAELRQIARVLLAEDIKRIRGARATDHGITPATQRA